LRVQFQEARSIATELGVVKKGLRKMGISWDEIEEARLRRTGKAGGMRVSPNAFLTRAGG